MTKKRALLALFMIALLMLNVTACGPKSDEGGMEAPTQSYEEQTFVMDNWEVTITKDSLVYEDYYECDDFVVYVTAKNIGEEAAKFSETANFVAFQNGETLDWGQAKENDEFLLNNQAAQEETAAGETVDAVYAWALKDDSAVTVKFGGYTVDTESTELTFEVADRITDTWKESIAAKEAEEAEKQSATGFDMVGVSGEFVDGWYAEYITDKDTELKRDGADGTITITSSTSRESAQAWAEQTVGNFSEPKEITSVTIGATTYLCIVVNDTQVELYVDGTDAVVKIRGMFCTLEDITPQVEAFTIK